MNDFSNLANLENDLFYDGEYCLNKIFTALYKGIPHEHKYSGQFIMEDAVDFVVSKYGLENIPGRIRHFRFYRKNEKNIHYIIHSRNGIPGSACFIIAHEGLLVKISEASMVLLYDDKTDKSEIMDLASGLAKFTKPSKKRKARFYMITKDYDGFSLSKFKVNKTNTDTSLHYNDDFISFDSDVKGFLLDKNRNGMILMHGASGTGKTTYIRHLIHQIKRKFIFLPLFMAESLSSPDLLPFLSDYKNSILIIEDCEKLIVDRESGNAQNEIATLLNLSDGLLSDALGIKLICTFNTGLSNIDKALLRKGRMVNRYEFKELTVEKAIKLSKKHNLKYKGDEPITLGDLFNIEKENETNTITKKTIGFNVRK